MRTISECLLPCVSIAAGVYIAATHTKATGDLSLAFPNTKPKPGFLLHHSYVRLSFYLFLLQMMLYNLIVQLQFFHITQHTAEPPLCCLTGLSCFPTWAALNILTPGVLYFFFPGLSIYWKARRNAMKFLSTEKFFLFIKHTERKKLCETMKLWELFIQLQLS